MTKKESIFVIEKDQELLEVLQLVLKHEYQVYSFNEAGDIFFDHLEKIKPDVILLEWLSGLYHTDEVIQKIKNVSNCSPKIIVNTIETDTRSFASRSDVDAIIIKPFRMHELKDVIKEVMSAEILQNEVSSQFLQ